MKTKIEDKLTEVLESYYKKDKTNPKPQAPAPIVQKIEFKNFNKESSLKRAWNYFKIGVEIGLIAYGGYFGYKIIDLINLKYINIPYIIVVKSGDTLSALTRDYTGDIDLWPKIAKFNKKFDENFDPNRIEPLQEIYLPKKYLREEYKE